MVILFFVALILAWPTMGLSILAYIVLVIVRGFLQAKAREQYANERQAQREIDAGRSRLPSWMGDRDKIEIFINGAQSLAEHHGVSKLWSAVTLANHEIQETLMHYAGSMEAQGASFEEQQMAVAEKLVKLHGMTEAE